MNILTLPITAAVAAVVNNPVKFSAPPNSLVVQGALTYGSGGTTIDCWVQTSVDGGATWTDIANFHFTTSAARFLFNLNSQTPVTTEYTPTDGSLASNTAKDGILGPQFRTKVTTTGTYAGNTSLSIDIACDQARDR